MVFRVGILTLQIMAIFFLIGCLIFLLYVLIYACEEGSCEGFACCAACICCCTCGLCDTRKDQKKRTND